MTFYLSQTKNYDMCQKLKSLEDHGYSFAKMGLYDGAGLVADSVKNVIPTSHGNWHSGGLRNSLGILTFAESPDSVKTSVGYGGYNWRNNAFSMIARTLNLRGKHKGFATATIRRAKPLAEEQIKKTIDKNLNVYFDE